MLEANWSLTPELPESEWPLEMLKFLRGESLQDHLEMCWGLGWKTPDSNEIETYLASIFSGARSPTHLARRMTGPLRGQKPSRLAPPDSFKILDELIRDC